MKYCYSCRRISPGGPRFCTWCGKSYDVKLCPRLHVNPRGAVVCAQCGSRDLSAPQLDSRLRFLLRVVGWILVLLLTFISICYLIWFASLVFADPDELLGPMLVGLLLSTVWVIAAAIAGTFGSRRRR